MKRFLFTLIFISLLLIGTIPFSVKADEFATYRESIIGWLKNSGVLVAGGFAGYQVIEGVKWSGSNWQLSTGAYGNAFRTDACAQVALAFLYQYISTGNAWYKDMALTLFREAQAESIASNPVRYPAMPTWYGGYASVYTQDNGRLMKELAKAVELTDDFTLKTWLNELVNYWNGYIGQNGAVGVGIDCVRLGNHLSPPTGVCARASTELLIGFCRAYQAIGGSAALNGANRLGTWLMSNFQSDHWPCPSSSEDVLMNGGLGNLIETNSLGLRAITLLWKITGNSAYRTLADKVYGWLKAQCDNTYSRWGVKLPSEYNRDSDFSRFNTLYSFTSQAFLEYGQDTSQTEPITYAEGILRFMCTTMMMHGDSIIEGGIVGEWNLQANTRSTLSDDENMIWGNWIYTGWTNTEAVEALGMLGSDGQIPPIPPLPRDLPWNLIFLFGAFGFVAALIGAKKHFSTKRRHK